MSDARHDDVTMRAFFTAVRDGDLDVFRRYFAQPHVRSNVDEMNARARAGGDAERDELWLESALHGDFVFGAIAHHGHVELLAWLFAEPMFKDALCVLVPRIMVSIIEGDRETTHPTLAREMLELVVTSPIFTTHMSDRDRHAALAGALSYAATSGANEWLEPLLAHGADATQSYAYVTPLFTASEGGDARTVQCLVANGAVVTQSDIVTQAVWEDNVEVVRELLRLGADPRSATVEHNAALLLAADYRFPELVKVLVRDGVVDVDARDNHGRTPLLVVAADEQQSGSEASLEITSFLLSHGADLFATDEDGSTVLHWAARTDDVALLRALLGRGCDPNVANDSGCTPLRELGECQMTDSVVALLDVLLQSGADPFLSCHAGQTAADVLERKRHGRAYVRRRRQFFRR